MSSLDESKLKSDLIFLISYLVTSARELIDDPKSYGPLRLMEATKRLISIMRSSGLSDANLEAVVREIDEGRLSQRMDQSEEEIAQTIKLLDLVVLKVLDAVNG